MIRRAVILALVLAGVAEATTPRTYIQRTNNVNNLHPDRFEWSQTDEVQFDLWPRAYSLPLELDGWFPMLFIADPVTETMYIAKTGSVVSAGRVRFGLDRAESNLSTSNNYLLTARLYNVLNVTQHVTIARGNLKVLWSPDATAYAPVGGLSPTTLVFQVTINMGEGSGGPVNWTNIIGIPAEFADGIDNVATTIPWSAITEVPAGFADGVDDTGATEAFVYQVLGQGIANVGRTTIGSTGGTVTVTGDPTSGYNLETQGGGGSGETGLQSINSVTQQEQRITAMYPLRFESNTNTGEHILGLQDVGGGVIIIPSWSNVNEFTFSGYVTQQFVIGTAQTYFVEGWGGAAGVLSPGGHGRGYLVREDHPFTITNGMILDIVIGEGGQVRTGGVATAWPFAGTGTSTNAQPAVSGAGLVAIFHGTNLIFSPGSAGGNRATAAGAPGGGLEGGYGGVAASGLPGTQTAAGFAGTTNATDGIGYAGGNGSPIGGLNPGSGGGAGFKGGGGGGGATSVNASGAGGGASAYIGGLKFASTERQAPDSNNPPGTSSPYYKSPWGVASATLTNFHRHNGGAIVIVAENPE